jgi:hypothetical protein
MQCVEWQGTWPSSTVREQVEEEEGGKTLRTTNRDLEGKGGVKIKTATLTNGCRPLHRHVGGAIRGYPPLTGPQLVDFEIRVARSEFGHDEGDGEVLELEGKENKFRVAKKTGGPVGRASPPIRDDASPLPKTISHKPLLSTGTSHCSVMRGGSFPLFFFGNLCPVPSWLFEKQSESTFFLFSLHRLPSVARKATPHARGTPGRFGTFGACRAPDIRGILGGLWPVRASPVYVQLWWRLCLASGLPGAPARHSQTDASQTTLVCDACALRAVQRAVLDEIAPPCRITSGLTAPRHHPPRANIVMSASIDTPHSTRTSSKMGNPQAQKRPGPATPTPWLQGRTPSRSEGGRVPPP